LKIGGRRFQKLPGRSGCSGFTLVELLVTVLLVALIVPVAMQGLSLAGKVASQATQKSEAIVLAERKMAELVLNDYWRNGDMAGDFGSDHLRYRWNAEVKTWTGEAALGQLDLWVTWESFGFERAVHLATLVFTGEV
jgi:prepilin-type N-terminal cleavage/methylation domain-containing protein